ncbi:MAG: hypothetical protein JO257_17925 [Deltaproteobacteria bacterium]|nr:hypothetical protein [Deltaproteobacteria bacterium]
MTKLVAGALLLIASTASAQTLVAFAPPPEKPAPRSVEAEVGMMMGGADAADVNGFSFGGTASVGYRIGDNALRASFDYYSVGDGYQEVMQRHGRATRVGGALRHSFRSTDRDRDFYGDLWGELGGGYEQIGWTSGGLLSRPDAELAFGVDLGFRNTKSQHITGTFMDFRAFLGEAPPDAHAMATCGGPCTEATTAPRVDVSMFFEMGVHWGQ